MGKYHPHGDQSIYATLVNMAQKDRHNNPYIESQGNFGSILSSLNDAAAPRYTELRLSDFATKTFFGEYYKELEYTETYDNRTKEPKVLLPIVPMILVKGTDGIAVGYTSTVPPHDYTSVCLSYIEYIKNIHLNNYISYNSKVILSFFFICLIAFILNIIKILI